MTIFFLTSCINSKKSKAENYSYSENKINQSKLIMPEQNQTESIVQKVLDLHKLQWIYHSESKERLPVKVLETELIEKNFELKMFGQKVRIMSKLKLEKEGILDYVIFDKLEIKTDTTDFEISYKIEGVGCSGKFLTKNGKWKIFNYSVWEN